MLGLVLSFLGKDKLVSIQLISLASRELKSSIQKIDNIDTNLVSIQLISLASREILGKIFVKWLILFPFN